MSRRRCARFHAGDRGAHQDSLPPGHRRKTPAAGRAHQAPNRRPRDRHPRLDHPDDPRRSGRAAYPRPRRRRCWARSTSAWPSAIATNSTRSWRCRTASCSSPGRPVPARRPRFTRRFRKINDTERKIITIEDPVEYQLKGVNQIQVNTKSGLTFAAGLRAILRHDPDVVLVGEIRDRETAEIAVQASLTGHLVFSTLHTNDAPGAATRLIDMGVEPYLVASSLEVVVAQRLGAIDLQELQGGSARERSAALAR